LRASRPRNDYRPPSQWLSRFQRLPHFIGQQTQDPGIPVGELMLRRGATLFQEVERPVEPELDAGDSRTKPPQHTVAKPEGHWKWKKGEREKGA
jgi:hypothetical protein